MIGTTVTLNGKEYKVVGTHKRSYLLERDGKQYKATADKIDKIKAQNQNKAITSQSRYPFIEKMIAFDRIFDKNAKIPETERECLAFFEKLEGQLSPENLSADGERSASAVRQLHRELMGAWRETESILGRKVEVNV